MQENKLFEALLDVIPFSAYAVDVDTFEVVYANKKMSDTMYDKTEEFCWKKLFGQEEVCSWCTISELKKREKVYKNDKIVKSFFDESTDTWLQTFDELVRWPDGRTVKYSIAVDISEQKEVQASLIKTHTKLAIQTKKLKEANQKLEHMATKDFLTCVNNRGNFFKLASEAFEKSLEEDEMFYAAVLDIDKFKNLNDSYGHKVGDEALIAFSRSVEAALDEADIFGRLGGEEFVVVTVVKSEKEVLEKFEKVRKVVESIKIEVPDQGSVSFTVSIGLAKKEGEKKLDLLVDQADKKLYQAKFDGRNRIIFRV